jgi:hypothetical protein
MAGSMAEAAVHDVVSNGRGERLTVAFSHWGLVADLSTFLLMDVGWGGIGVTYQPHQPSMRLCSKNRQ